MTICHTQFRVTALGRLINRLTVHHHNPVCPSALPTATMMIDMGSLETRMLVRTVSAMSVITPSVNISRIKYCCVGKTHPKHAALSALQKQFCYYDKALCWGYESQVTKTSFVQWNAMCLLGYVDQVFAKHIFVV